MIDRNKKKEYFMLGIPLIDDIFLMDTMKIGCHFLCTYGIFIGGVLLITGLNVLAWIFLDNVIFQVISIPVSMTLILFIVGLYNTFHKEHKEHFVLITKNTKDIFKFLINSEYNQLYNYNESDNKFHSFIETYLNHPELLHNTEYDFSSNIEFKKWRDEKEEYWESFTSHLSDDDTKSCELLRSNISKYNTLVDTIKARIHNDVEEFIKSPIVKICKNNSIQGEAIENVIWVSLLKKQPNYRVNRNGDEFRIGDETIFIIFNTNINLDDLLIKFEIKIHKIYGEHQKSKNYDQYNTLLDSINKLNKEVTDMLINTHNEMRKKKNYSGECNYCP